MESWSGRRELLKGCLLLLARATEEQKRFIGNQSGGRVFLFLYTDDFDRDYALYQARGVVFIRPPSRDIREGSRV